MLHEVQGDILLTKAQVIAHGVAPDDHFNSGTCLVASRSLAGHGQGLPALLSNDPARRRRSLGLGRSRRARIVNLLTQDGSYDEGGRPGKATLQHVGHALHALRKLIADENFTSVAIPRLATGVGGLHWTDVEPLVRKHLGDLKIPVYVYTVYHKGLQAKEN